jgi:4-diphosphocytidyl-2C-methyl-D-erythritol kinase
MAVGVKKEMEKAAVTAVKQTMSGSGPAVIQNII